MNKFSQDQPFVPRIDGADKATGKTKYAADYSYPGMLYGAMKFSARQHALIRHIEIPVLQEDDYVITGKDLQEKCLWDIVQIIADERVKSFCDVVAIAAAPTLRRAREIIDAIEVDYEPLPVVDSIDEGLKADVVIHDRYQDNIWPASHHVIKKTVEEREPDFIFEREYQTQLVEHAYLEPEAVLVVPEFDQYKVYVSVQYPFNTRMGVAKALGIPFSRVSVVQATVGGTFGGKEESSALISARAALLSRASGRPVKMVFTREESIAGSVKRHPFRMRYHLELNHNGDILKWQSRLVDDMGAYDIKARNMNWRGSVHAAGPYECLSWDTDIKGVFTNHLMSGAMRGYSSPQIIFAHESLIDEIAHKLGKDIVAYRKQICLKDGGLFATGQTIEHVPFVDMLNEVEKTFSEWDELYKDLDKNRFAVGKGVAISMRGCGFGAEYPDATGAQITILKDGSILLQTSLAEVGQGLHTALAVIVCKVLGVTMDRLRFPQMNTSYMEDGGTTAASRGCYAGGSAMLDAANKMLQRIKLVLGMEYHCDTEQITVLEGEGFLVNGTKVTFDEMVPLIGKKGQSHSVLGWFSPETVVIDHATGQGNAYKDYMNNCVAALSVINKITGEVEVRQVLSLHEAGTIIHQGNMENQAYGGVAMGLGMALTEEVITSDRGIKTANLDSYIIPTAMDVPETVVRFMEIPSYQGPFGAKSMGEPGTECVAAAVARSVCNGLGIEMRALPLTQEKIAECFANA